MKLLTFLTLDEINEYAKLEGAELNKAKEVLAFELTKMVHGEEEAKKANDAAKALFGSGSNNADMPSTTLSDDDFTDGKITIIDLMLKGNMIKSKGEGRRLVDQGGVSVNDEKVSGALTAFDKDFFSNEAIVKKGKKVFHKFTL